MEEALVVLLQFLVEVVVQVLVYMPFDLPLDRNARTGRRRGAGWALIYLLVGGVVGGLSLLVVPRLMLHSPGLRMANLAVAPVAAGAVSWAVARWRQSRGAAVCPRTHFWTGFWFVLAFAGIRLAYAD